MKKLLILFISTLPIASANTVRTVSATLVSNGSFEFPILPNDTFCITFADPFCPAVPGWTGEFHIVHSTSAGTSAGPPPAPIPDGDQYSMLQATAFFNQTITIPAAGVYTLSWFEAGRGPFVGRDGNQTYSVSFGGNVLGLFGTSTGSPWTQRTLSISTGPGDFLLQFAGLTTFATGAHAVYLDNITLNAPDAPPTSGVPEPSTLALTGGAFALLTLRRFRIILIRVEGQGAVSGKVRVGPPSKFLQLLVK